MLCSSYEQGHWCLYSSFAFAILSSMFVVLRLISVGMPCFVRILSFVFVNLTKILHNDVAINLTMHNIYHPPIVFEKFISNDL